jgi:hypothetical protein
MTKQRAILGLVVVAVTCVTSWFFRPTPRYDVDRVNPRLRSLQKPYQNVKTGYYLDGGSIGIEIVDRAGTREQFCLPAHLGDTNPYTRVFVGAMYDRKSGAVEILEPEHTKRMLIQILASAQKRTAEDDLCLMMLRRRPSDFAICLIHKWTGKYSY